MTKVTIDRELLERAARMELDTTTHSIRIQDELRAILDAPRQPEGEAISRERVQAEADAFFDWPTTDKSSVTTTSCLIFARCIAGMVAAERDATIAELREELDAAREILAQQGRRNTELRAERDTLRQQLAERDAQIASMRAEVTQFIDTHWRPVAEQRDKLADLLIRARGCIDAMGWGELETDIDAALAEVNK